MKNTHRKGLIPSGEYHFTIRQSTPHPDSENILRWVWTINTGELAWRNLVETFNLDTEMYKVTDICQRLNFEYYSKGHQHFFGQFLGLEAKLNVGVDMNRDHRYKQNVVLEYMLPDHAPEIDVTSEKDSSHFFANKKKRNLPI